MSNIIPFTFQQQNEIRSVVIDGLPYFVAKDIALALGYSNPGKAVRDHCIGRTIQTPLETAGGTQKLRIIAEPDCYRLIMRSNLPSAIDFQDWLFKEVLPQVRATGSYSPDAQNIPQTLSEALHFAAELEEQRVALAVKVEQDAPKVEFYDAVVQTSDCHTLEEAAKLIGTGRTRLTRWLRGRRVFQPNSTMPYQKHIDVGYFKVIETPWRDKLHAVRLSANTLVTGKGLTKLQKEWAMDENKPANLTSVS